MVALVQAVFITPASSVRFLEMIVRTGDAIQSEADIDYMISQALRTHIEGLSVLMKDDESGLLYYTGSTVPSTRSYNASAGLDYDSLIKYLLSTAHQSGLKVYAWLPMFKDPVLAQADYELATMQKENSNAPLEMSQLFVSPVNPAVRAHEQDLISEVLDKFDFDGVRLDFIRYDSDFSDLSNYTRGVFKSEVGVDPNTIQSDSDYTNWDKWVDFRAAQITSFLKEVVKTVSDIDSSLDVGAYVLPFAASADGYYGNTQSGNDYSQYTGNWIKIMPMVYWQDWATADNFYDWVNQTIFYANHLTKAKVIPVFSVTSDYAVSEWPLQPNDTMVDYYLSRAFATASDNDCPSVSLFYYGKWSDETFQRVAISGDRSMGMSLWNGKHLTLTIVFFLLTCYSFYKIETLFLSLL